MAQMTCAHEACKCRVEEGQTYCSDHCRQNAGKEAGMCRCGHPDCK